MISFDKFLCILTGRKFQFHATLRYTPDPKNGAICVTRVISFSCKQRCSKTLYRDIRKSYGGSFFSTMPKHMLKNGVFEIVSISYLGFFK